MLFISKKCFGRRTFSGCLRLFAFALLAAAFAFTSAHAQTVGYISHNNSVVSVLDPATNTITGSFALGGSTQFFVTTSPDGKHAYVSYSPEGLQAFIAVIDTATNQVTGTISFAGVPQGMAITPDGRKLYVTDVFNSNLLAFSTADGTLLSTIPVDPVPLNLAITPDGSRAYVFTSGVIDVVDTVSDTVIDSIEILAGNSWGIVVTPDGSRVYVGNGFGTGIFAISTADDTVTEIPFDKVVISLAITPDGKQMYGSDPINNSIWVIDPATNTVNPTPIPVGNSPEGLTSTPDGAFVYVANFSSDTISVISTASNTVVATIADPGAPQFIAFTKPLKPPTAVAGPNQTVSLGQIVQLDGSGSFAPNTLPANLQYAWSFVSQPIGSTAGLNGADTARPTFVADVPGSFVVQLVVTDPATMLSSTPSQVTISSIWSPPTADAGPNRSVTVGVNVGLIPAGSDPNGLPLTFVWSFVSKPAGSAATINYGPGGQAGFVPDVAGQYVVQLVASDQFGSSQPSLATITATSPETAQQLIQDAINHIAAMPTANFDAGGHRNALSNQLQQAIIDLQNGKTSQAIGKVTDSVTRTDGFPLRGAADGNGQGMDWIINQTDQEFVYGKLTAALRLMCLKPEVQVINLRET